MSPLIVMFCDMDDFCKGCVPLYLRRLLQIGVDDYDGVTSPVLV